MRPRRQGFLVLARLRGHLRLCTWTINPPNGHEAPFSGQARPAAPGATRNQPSLLVRCQLLQWFLSAFSQARSALEAHDVPTRALSIIHTGLNLSVPFSCLPPKCNYHLPLSLLTRAPFDPSVGVHERLACVSDQRSSSIGPSGACRVHTYPTHNRSNPAAVIPLVTLRRLYQVTS